MDDLRIKCAACSEPLMVDKNLIPTNARMEQLVGMRFPCFYCEEPNEIFSVGDRIDARVPEKSTRTEVN